MRECRILAQPPGRPVMNKDFRGKALDAFREARATHRMERKMRLLALAEAWRNLADHEERVQRLEAEIERSLNPKTAAPQPHG